MSNFKVFGEAGERVDEVGAQMRIYILWAELGMAFAVRGPHSVVAHHALPRWGGVR